MAFTFTIYFWRKFRRKEGEIQGVISCGGYTRGGYPHPPIFPSSSQDPRPPTGLSTEGDQSEDPGRPVTFSQVSVPVGASERVPALHACCLPSVKRSALPIGSRRHCLCSRASGWVVGKADRLWLSLRTWRGAFRASGQRQGAPMVWQKGLWPQSEQL